MGLRADVALALRFWSRLVKTGFSARIWDPKSSTLSRARVWGQVFILRQMQVPTVEDGLTLQSRVHST